MASKAPQTKVVDSKRIACDGEGGALGHPRVWLQMPASGEVDCPYCDCKYIYQGAQAKA